MRIPRVRVRTQKQQTTLLIWTGNQQTNEVKLMFKAAPWSEHKQHLESVKVNVCWSTSPVGRRPLEKPQQNLKSNLGVNLFLCQSIAQRKLTKVGQYLWDSIKPLRENCPTKSPHTMYHIIMMMEGVSNQSSTTLLLDVMIVYAQ